MLELKNIYKNYILTKTEDVKVLKDVNLIFEEHKFISILGPSGCGKTTLLNIIGGLDRYTSGDLVIDGKSTKDFTDKDWDAYRNRKIGFVFQTYNLIPHLSVLGNIEISLTLAGIGIEKRREMAINALTKVGLEAEIKKRPNQLSGGQMQRVAIARAIVNNPSIILADEPTGALDSETSVIVMDILKEISKDKTIIMVTHNKDLAYKYSDKIVEMLDGRIVGYEDNKKKKENIEPINKEKTEEVLINEIEQPIETINTQNNKDHKKIKNPRTSMGFFTSVNLAWKNIFAKKGRSILVSVASSFGVIGVGLVLALSNGFTTYITRLEEATAQNSPLTISNMTYSYVKNENKVEYDVFPDDNQIHIYKEDEAKSYVTEVHRNNFSLDYINYLNDIANTKYASSLGSKLINFNNINMGLFSNDGEKVVNVNPYRSTDSSLISDIASITGLPKTILHEMYGKEDYIRKSYDVFGVFPSQEMVDTNGDGETDTFEVSLVVDSYNRVSQKTLVDFGLYNKNQLKDLKTINFNDFIGKEYKFYINDEVYDEGTIKSHVYPEKTSSISFMDETGAIQKFDVTLPSTTTEQYVPVYDVSNSANKSLYNETFVANGKVAKAYKLKVTSILRVKKDAILDYMPTSICYNECFKNFVMTHNNKSKLVNTIKDNLYFNSLSELERILTKTNYLAFMNEKFGTKYKIPAAMSVLKQPKLEEIMDAYNKLVHFTVPFQDFVNGSGYEYSDSYYTSASGFFSTVNYHGGTYEMTDAMKTAFDLLGNNDIENLFRLFAQQPTLAKDFVIYLGYILSQSSNILSIILFPSSLTKKAQLIEYLNAYNVGKKDADQIIFSDYIGTFTNSIGEMVNIISIVLVAFAAVSLVVSSVMTGIITYNSVIERTKEIGILRAIGARKRDVGRLFRTENIMQGFAAGLIGIIMTYILSAPLNYIINIIYPSYNIGNIAFLNPLAGFILVVLAIALSFIASLIPSSVASRKDPVVSLRTE
ncbi:MAG: ATP-binding cassette domain-containing protein [Bacilli bacterium]